MVYFQNKQTGTLKSSCKACCLKYQKQYNRENSEHIREYQKQYQTNNKVKINKRQRHRYRTDEHYRLSCQLRTQLGNIVYNRQYVNPRDVYNLVSCSKEWLILWLNFHKALYCPNAEDVHVDHFYPLVIYELGDRIQRTKAMCWCNLRFIPAKENLEKHDRIPDRFDMERQKQYLKMFMNYMSTFYPHIPY